MAHNKNLPKREPRKAGGIRLLKRGCAADLRERVGGLLEENALLLEKIRHLEEIVGDQNEIISLKNRKIEELKGQLKRALTNSDSVDHPTSFPGFVFSYGKYVRMD